MDPSSNDPRSIGSMSTTPHLNHPPGQDQLPSSRLMQVKILYNLNDDDKTNCLARLPHPIPIQTAALDETTLVGVVGLRTCIQAIVSASPELIAKFGQDFTVYAYDYSEYETPLVGQGMLSRVLASASATPTAPAGTSLTMVTGRVSKNVLGLFGSNGISETLQVKLRLVPVPTSLQGEYVESMEKSRDTSNFATQSSDANAWSNFIRQNPTFTMPQAAPQPAHWNALPAPSNHGSVQAQASLQGQNQVQSAPVASREAGSYFTFNQSDMAAADPIPSSSRPGTPQGKRQQQTQPRSRPASRNGPRPGASKRRESMNASDAATSNQGPSKKRARVEKTNWHGPSSLESTNEPLRKAASAAASIRGRSAVAAHPSASAIAAAEPANRPPTPRPSPSVPNLARKATTTGHDVLTNKSRDYHSPFNSSAQDTSGDALDSAVSDGPSPAGNYGMEGFTPYDIPSSPPMLENASTTSSPPLLRKYTFPDSGFVSGAPDEGLEDDDMRAPDEEDIEDATRSSGRDQCIMSDALQGPALSHERSFGQSSVEDQILPAVPYCAESEPDTSPKTQQQCPSPQLKTEPLEDTNQSELPVGENQSANANVDPSRLSILQPAIQRPVPRRDSSATSSSRAAHAESELVKALEGSGLRRKKAIQSRLQSDIAAGKFPPYCKNCGQINTPTWRKCFIRTEQGSPEDINLEDNDEGICAWEVVERAEDGNITSYRAIKRSLQKGEEGFEEMQLCNPCGMWLWKNKCMRPPEKWNNQEKQASSTTARRKKPKPKKVPPPPGSEPDIRPRMSPEEAALLRLASQDDQGADADSESQPSGRSDKSLPKTTGRTQRSTSAKSQKRGSSAGPFLADAAATAALQKAIDSSPPKFPGSKAKPIELDMNTTPDKTRRVLFPSPKNAGHVKSLEDSADTPSQRASRERRAAASKTKTISNLDQENLPPALPSDDETAPSKRTPLRRSPRKILSSKSASPKTPERVPGSKRATPRGSLTSAAKRFLNDVGSSPSRRTRSSAKKANTLSPFSRQLSQMFSDPQFPQQSPSRPSYPTDQLPALLPDTFDDTAALFNFSDFLPDDTNYATGDEMAIPHSDGLFNLYEDAAEPGSDFWTGEPLLEGELDALLREAGEDAYKEGSGEACGLGGGGDVGGLEGQGGGQQQ